MYSLRFISFAVLTFYIYLFFMYLDIIINLDA